MKKISKPTYEYGVWWKPKFSYYFSDESFSIEGIHRFIMRDVLSGQITSDNTYENLITTVLKAMVAARLAGGSADTDITYGALGTGSGTPAIGDTTLFTELVRKVFASISSSGPIVSTTAFFGAAEGNSTLTEYAGFGNGATGAADSGTMANHVAISEVKSSSETLTVESKYTIT